MKVSSFLTKMMYTSGEISSCIHRVTGALSEQSILVLQDKFLTPGFEYLMVREIRVGRRLVHTFLELLAYRYHNVACLTLSLEPLQQSVYPLHQELLHGGYVDNLRSLEQFFIERFYFDFLWIEATDTLIISEWFNEFAKILIDFNVQNHIPIFIIIYEDDESV
jgi:hypothetical protein